MNPDDQIKNTFNRMRELPSGISSDKMEQFVLGAVAAGSISSAIALKPWKLLLKSKWFLSGIGAFTVGTGVLISNYASSEKQAPVVQTAHTVLQEKQITPETKTELAILPVAVPDTKPPIESPRLPIEEKTDTVIYTYSSFSSSFEETSISEPFIQAETTENDSSSAADDTEMLMVTSSTESCSKKLSFTYVKQKDGLMDNLIAQLVTDGYITDTSDFSFSLTRKRFIVNHKTYSESERNRYIKIYETHSGTIAHKRFEIEYSVEPN
jgi:hypothetical protein